MVTTFDLLLLLAAVLASAFGWSAIQGIPSVYIIVAASLLCLLLEEIVRLVAHRVLPNGWPGTLTKADVLILLAAHHPFALLLAVFWVLTALLMVVGWVLLRHASPVGDAPEKVHDQA